MSGKYSPVFVQRGTYRRRRVADGARLLPVLGLILILIPLLWQIGIEPGDEITATGRTAWVMTYLFLIWLGLAMLAGVLSWFLPDKETTAEDDGER